MADVGLIGMLVELILFGRLVVLAGRAARTGSDAGWVALALIAALMLYALTRAAFTGFPTAFLGLLLIGIAVAAAGEEQDASTRVQAR
jgi:p-aminobenzoyl-glutamate transporter AbgT